MFGEIDCRSKSDGIVMGILRCAMDKAHEKIQSEAGSIEFLHERSKFYELAVILVESGLGIIHQETDILETNREKVILDLTEMRHWLLGRIKVMMLLINEKDRELTERIEHELKLRQVLESKEREVIFLRNKLENQRTMSEGSLDLGLLLKNNKVETSDSKSDSELLNEERCQQDYFHGSFHIPKINPMIDSLIRPEEEKVIQQMSSDINILKQTLDFAFGRRDNGEIVSVEKQWSCSIEKDILSVLIRGFIIDTKLRFEDTLKETFDDNADVVILKENVYKVFFMEMFKAWKEERDDFEIEVYIREDLYKFIMIEVVKYLNPTYKKVEIDGTEESLIQKLDSLLKCLESEEDVMVQASSEIEEHNVRHEQEILECEGVEERETIKWLLNDDESTFNSVNEKLEIAMKKLSTSKELLFDLEQSLGISPDCQYTNTNFMIETDKPSQESIVQVEDNKMALINSSDVVWILAQLSDFHQVIREFEINVVQNLCMKSSRIEELKHQFHDLIIEPVALIKKRKLFYKKAFLSRCQNLKLAETEVDLLGDQVETLLHLLENIYIILDQNSTILSCHFQVFDILNLIKDELANGVACASSS